MPSLFAITPKTRADVIARLGSYLDSTEAGIIPCDARSYQRVAHGAAVMLSLAGDCPLAQEAVEGSLALRDLRSNRGIAKAINIGLLEAPEELSRAMRKKT
jgi:hypothetical protein